jgi:hypothetical protein
MKATTSASSRKRPSAPDSSQPRRSRGSALRRRIERSDAVGGGERVDRERSVGRSVEARRMV